MRLKLYIFALLNLLFLSQGYAQSPQDLMAITKVNKELLSYIEQSDIISWKKRSLQKLACINCSIEQVNKYDPYRLSKDRFIKENLSLLKEIVAKLNPNRISIHKQQNYMHDYIITVYGQEGITAAASPILNIFIVKRGSKYLFSGVAFL